MFTRNRKYQTEIRLIVLAIAIFNSNEIAAKELEFDKNDLGFLRNYNSDLLRDLVVSADGRVVAGYASRADGTFHAFRHNEGDGKMIDLGTLKNDNNGLSRAMGISADGRVVVGFSDTDNGNIHAFRHNDLDAKMTDLGTLRNDNGGYSVAIAASANGRVVIGEATSEKGDSHAFRHNEGDLKMTDLGTLRSDDTGSSIATALSSDGRVVVGQADAGGGAYHAFRHNEGDERMTDLGTLRSDNSGYSQASSISADGRVIVGEAQTDNSGSSRHAFRHREGDQKMTDLGTLKSDNSGSSTAYAASADGRVVIGYADTDSGTSHAFRHNEGDAKVSDLGTLRGDNSGSSSAAAVSADGLVVVGQAENDRGEIRAFTHTEGDEKMTDLGTLKSDNTGSSMAKALSADGQIIVGEAQTDSGAYHATVWKVKQNIIVDATNSNKTIAQTAKDAYKVLDLYRSSLMGLSKTECSLDSFSYCIGSFTQYDALKSNYSWTTGLFGAVKLSSQWRVGASVNYLSDSSLPEGYSAQSSSKPGVGGFIRFQQNEDKTGVNVTASGGYQEQKVDIRRQQLSHTEAGLGSAKIRGTLADLDVSYGYKASDGVTVFPHTGLNYTKVSRGAYHEEKDAEFPAYYGEMGEKSTAVTLGLAVDYYLSEKVSLSTDVGLRVNLEQKRKAFTGNIDYIGAHFYDFGPKKKNQPYVDIGIKGTLTKHSVVNLNLGWTQQSYDHDTTRIGVSYAYRF